MFNWRHCNAATIWYSQLKFGHMHICGMDYKYFSPHCCKCNSFGCTAAIRCGNACHGTHSDSLCSGNEHTQFNSPRIVKREAGFPNPRRALIGSLPIVHDSMWIIFVNIHICLIILCNLIQWHFNLHISTYWLSWLTFTTFCQFKTRKQKLRNIMKCVENSVSF